MKLNIDIASGSDNAVKLGRFTQQLAMQRGKREANCNTSRVFAVTPPPPLLQRLGEMLRQIGIRRDRKMKRWAERKRRNYSPQHYGKRFLTKIIESYFRIKLIMTIIPVTSTRVTTSREVFNRATTFTSERRFNNRLNTIDDTEEWNHTRFIQSLTYEGIKPTVVFVFGEIF